MEDKDVLLTWNPLKGKIRTKGHQMPDGWWYVYLPLDGDWHFVPESDVEVVADGLLHGDAVRCIVGRYIKGIGGLNYSSKGESA